MRCIALAILAVGSRPLVARGEGKTSSSARPPLHLTLLSQFLRFTAHDVFPSSTTIPYNSCAGDCLSHPQCGSSGRRSCPCSGDKGQPNEQLAAVATQADVCVGRPASTVHGCQPYSKPTKRRRRSVWVESVCAKCMEPKVAMPDCTHQRSSRLVHLGSTRWWRHWVDRKSRRRLLHYKEAWHPTYSRRHHHWRPFREYSSIPSRSAGEVLIP